jgi:hypothetical protein
MLTAAFAAILSIATAGTARADGMVDRIDSLFGTSGITLDVRSADPRFPPHTAHFSSDSLATLGLLVGQLAASAADFPAISTVPGFTYTYNTALEVFERLPGPLGPVYVERARTLGAGRFDVGTSFLFVDYDDLDGEDIDSLEFRGLAHNDCCGNPPDPGNPEFENDTADVFFDKFTLRSYVFSFFATYGLTDRWDVNILLPVVHTTMDIDARAVLNNEASDPDVHFFDVETRRTVDFRSTDDEATGVGDLQLRTKFALLQGEPLDFAGGLNLRVPTGDEDDFQGIGDTTLAPFVAAQRRFGNFDAHANGGIEVNFDDSDRSRLRYGAGVTWQAIERLALLADVVGSSNLKTDRIGVRVPVFSSTGQQLDTFRVSRNIATDRVDFLAGVKTLVAGSGIAFATVFVPLNDDGLRADLIPAVGFEWGF